MLNTKREEKLDQTPPGFSAMEIPFEEIFRLR
jgi:hypothetical protein